jgi:hypothetical protein
MATYDWPTAFTPQTVSWGLRKAGVQFRSPFGGTLESVAFPGSWWAVTVSLPPRLLAVGSAGAAFFERLAGGVDRVRVPYWPRLKPRGTLRGTPVLELPVARGDSTLYLNGSGSLQAGDMLGIGSQLFRVAEDCADLAGSITVPVANRSRSAIAAGSIVTWDRPTAICCMPAMTSARGFEPGIASSLGVDLEEVP